MYQFMGPGPGNILLNFICIYYFMCACEMWSPVDRPKAPGHVVPFFSIRYGAHIPYLSSCIYIVVFIFQSNQRIPEPTRKKWHKIDE